MALTKYSRSGHRIYGYSVTQRIVVSYCGFALLSFLLAISVAHQAHIEPQDKWRAACMSKRRHFDAIVIGAFHAMACLNLKGLLLEPKESMR